MSPAIPPKQLWRRRRVKTPTVLQMEAVECGAASLAMIFAFHKLWIPLEKLRIDCGVSRDGSKASNILKAARKYGFEARGFRKEPSGLHSLPLPMILFWNFNHFVVLEGIKGKKAYINDPAGGPRTLTKEELDRSFTGVALTFTPTPEFKKSGKRPGVLASLAGRFSGAKTALYFTLLAALFLIVPGIVIPVFSRIFVDSILVGRMEGWLPPLLTAMGATLVVQTGLKWLQDYTLLRQETRMSLISSAQFFFHAFRLPISFFAQRFPGEISQRIQSNFKVAKILSADLTGAGVNIFSILFFAAVMFFYDVPLTLIGIIAAFLNLALLRLVQKRQEVLNTRLLQEQSKLTGLTMSGIQMIETLKATGRESDFFANWAGVHAKAFNAQQETGVNTMVFSAIPPFLTTLTNLAVLILGGFRVMDGHLSMGELVAFQSLMQSFVGPVNSFTQLGRKLQTVRGDLNRLEDVLGHEVAPVFREAKAEPAFAEPAFSEPFQGRGKLSGEVAVRDLRFGYNILEPPLVDGFSLSLTPGMRVALVGRSGSGKSTLAKLIAGLYEPWEGEILFDGCPLSQVPRPLLSNSLSMVDQDIFIFGGTVRENITMWDATIPTAQMVRAAKDAEIHATISEKPEGYDGKVAEGGSNFSGGQRQRLEIARALATDPTILVMDEATSALDANTEKAVADHIRKRGCSCIIVAHRLSTIRDCDRIIVMENGNAVQEGTHERLMAEGGLYADLIRQE